MTKAEKIARDWNVYFLPSGEVNNDVVSAIQEALNTWPGDPDEPHPVKGVNCDMQGNPIKLCVHSWEWSSVQCHTEVCKRCGASRPKEKKL